MEITVILIDPEKQTVTSEIIPNTLRGFYDLLDCDMIEAAYPEEIGDHFIYCDEEGTFKTPLYFFGFGGFVQPLCGKACIVKADRDESISCTLSVEEVRDRVLFFGRTK